MSQKTIKTFTTSCLHTWQIGRTTLVSGVSYNKKEDLFSVITQRININSTDGEKIDYIVFQWSFNADVRSALGIDNEDTSIEVQSVECGIYYQKADNPFLTNSIRFVPLTNTDISNTSASSLWSTINSNQNNYYQEQEVRGDKKSSIIVQLGSESTDQICADVLIALLGDEIFSLAIITDPSQTNNYIEISGTNILAGTETNWRLADTNEIHFQPYLRITYAINPRNHITQDMRYTTVDPTTNQNSPNNSLGGYFAPNNIYTTAEISSFVGRQQTTINISEDSALPETSNGLIQVGPEIMRYKSVNSTNHMITDITRGISPPDAYPSSLDPFPERVEYLTIDNLFNNRPTTGLVQYRCVAILQTSAFEAQNTMVTLIQDPNADAKIDIGIEIPKFDAIQTTIFGNISAGDTSFIVNDSSILEENGFFNNAYIILDPDVEVFECIVTDYQNNGTISTFTVDRSMPSILSGSNLRISPAPSQIIENEITAPVENSGRFFGFFGEDGSNNIGFNDLRQNKGTLKQYDLFYIWIKRTLSSNVISRPDTGSIIMLRFVDTSAI